MLDAGELASLVGYTAIASATVEGDVEGSDGELVKLDNGMIYELVGFYLMAEYDPEVVVFEWIVTPADAKRLFQRDTQETVGMYKLVIGDELVDALRVR
jgi:hypothetical protein